MNSVGIYKEFLNKASGAGSRGGHVIGHTRSGKPIYARSGSAGKGKSLLDNYKHFSAQDHRDAEAAHRKASQKQNESGLKPYEQHSFHERIHGRIAGDMERGEGKGKDYHQKMHAYHVQERDDLGGRMGNARARGDWSAHSAEKLNNQAAALLAVHHAQRAG